MVDTSSWIALFRNHLRKFHEKTWAGMDGLIGRGRVTSPRIVHAEISARQDGLLSWVDRRPEIFSKPDREMLELVAQINSRFPLLNKNKSRFDADSHVIALAAVIRRRGLLGRPLVVVTEEASSPNRPTKIPHVARQYGISCVSLAGMLGHEEIAG